MYLLGTLRFNANGGIWCFFYNTITGLWCTHPAVYENERKVFAGGLKYDLKSRLPNIRIDWTDWSCTGNWRRRYRKDMPFVFWLFYSFLGFLDIALCLCSCFLILKLTRFLVGHLFNDVMWRYISNSCTTAPILACCLPQLSCTRAQVGTTQGMHASPLPRSYLFRSQEILLGTAEFGLLAVSCSSMWPVCFPLRLMKSSDFLWQVRSLKTWGTFVIRCVLFQGKKTPMKDTSLMIPSDLH